MERKVDFFFVCVYLLSVCCFLDSSSCFISILAWEDAWDGIGWDRISVCNGYTNNSTGLEWTGVNEKEGGGVFSMNEQDRTGQNGIGNVIYS
jgi:hypothetical protein